MRPNVKESLILSAVLLLALPVGARTISVAWSISHAVMIGGTRVQPGDYEIKAEEGQTQLQVEHNGKVVAQVPCKWIQLPTKATSDGVVVSDGRVIQIDFNGQTEAVQFSQ